MRRCQHIRPRLVALVAGDADTHESAVLEEHLNQCVPCQEIYRVLWAGTVELREFEPSARSDSELSRVVSRAVAIHAQRRHRSPWVPALLAAGALASGMALFGWLDPLGHDHVFDAGVAITVEDGRAMSFAHSYERGAHFDPEDAVLLTFPVDSKLRLGDGSRVALGAATRVRVVRAGWRLELERGSVDLEVTPRGAENPTVVTAELSVYVVGTRFRVACDALGTHIEVSRGAVDVQLRGQSERRRLGVDERLDAPVVVAASPPPPPPRRPQHAPAPRGTEIDDIRQVLRTGDTSRAEGLIAGARRRAVGNDILLAELGLLEAEALLTSGRLSAAVDAYVQISSRYAHLPQGETSLFAAAQVAADRLHDAARARSLATTYQQKYPTGLFVDEARRILGHETGPGRRPHGP
ncbi:MAG: FecR family protein [Myxococcota bacterium]